MNYIPPADFIAYAAARGKTFTTAQAEIQLTNAMDYMKLLPWVGYKTDPAQELDWPRSGIPGVDPLSVPTAVKDAQCRLAMLKMDLLPSFGAGPIVLKKRLEGVGSFEYDKNSYGGQPMFPWLDRLLAPYLDTDNEYPSHNFHVMRG